MEKEVSVSGALTGTLFIVFLVLKLTNVIDWSWWWVTCPLWGPLVLTLGIILVFFLIALPVGFFVALFGGSAE